MAYSLPFSDCFRRWALGSALASGRRCYMWIMFLVGWSLLVRHALTAYKGCQSAEVGLLWSGETDEENSRGRVFPSSLLSVVAYVRIPESWGAAYLISMILAKGFFSEVTYQHPVAILVDPIRDSLRGHHDFSYILMMELIAWHAFRTSWNCI